jgi:hypothetical protein
MTPPLRQPALARLLWVAALLVALICVAAGTPRRFTQLRTVSPTAITVLGQLTPADADRMARSGLSVEAYAAYFTAAEVASALVVLAVAGLIFWGRPTERAALLVSGNLVAAAAVLPLASALEAAHPLCAVVILAWRMAFAGSLLLLFLLFPDGRFVPRWTRWLGVAWLGYTALWPFFPRLQPPFSFGRGLSAADTPTAVLLLGTILAGVLNQVWRYVRVSSPLERQRTRWVVLGLALLLLLTAAGITTLTYLTVAPVGLAHLAARLAGPTFILGGLNAVALSIGLSVLRYRLWDIDVLIRRTLIYSLLTAALALAYFASVVALQAGFGLLTGEARNELVTVISTLTIAALFVPLRTRVQQAIDQRFYRRKYNAARTLAAFGAQARAVVELEQLEGQLVRVVEETMQPAHVGLWVRPAPK